MSERVIARKKKEKKKTDQTDKPCANTAISPNFLT